MTTIYRCTKTDQRHRIVGTYVDVSGCFELPVGPFQSHEQASTWVRQNADALAAKYGPAAAQIASH